MEITIVKEDAGMLLRDYLRYRLRASRRLMIRLKNDPQGMLLNGRRVTVRAVLSEGDVLALAIADEESGSEAVMPSEAAWNRIRDRIVYEDARMLAVNKPFLMPTHPSRNHGEDSLASGLCERARQAGEPFVCRAVNRLDRDTSGLVLVAKDQLSAFHLSSQIAEGAVEKRYIAILRGELRNGEPPIAWESPMPQITPGEGGFYRLRTRIRRTAESIITREATMEESGIENAEAVTDFRPLFTFKRGDRCYTAVLCRPVTGRTHQLRVHFAFLGYPIEGDTLYGAEEGCVLQRQALHAGCLIFAHPETGAKMHLIAPLPEDMRALLGELCKQTEQALNC